MKNEAFETSNVAFEMENEAFETSNVAFEMENEAFEISNVAFEMENEAFETSNVAFEMENEALRPRRTWHLTKKNEAFFGRNGAPARLPSQSRVRRRFCLRNAAHWMSMHEV